MDGQNLVLFRLMLDFTTALPAVRAFPFIIYCCNIEKIFCLTCSALYLLLIVLLSLVLDCVKCPNRATGQICSSSNVLPSSCKNGEIPNYNGTFCTPCRAGYYCSAAANFEEKSCPQGEWSLEGSSQCSNCPLGFECPTKDNLPKACLSGWYASNKNSLSCTKCPAGFYCVNSKSSPKLCPSGKFICHRMYFLYNTKTKELK